MAIAQEDVGWVVVPTYNEAANVASIARAVLALGPTWHALIVDDGSPDGTARIARAAANDAPAQLAVLERTHKAGYGAAVLAGMREALARGATHVYCMDSDWSHDPAMLPQMQRALERVDVVVGSRYVQGGGIRNWPMRRRVMSALANRFARTVVGLRVNDCTGGFRGFRRAVVADLVLQRVESQSYTFLTESMFLVQRLGYSVTEVPIVFQDRKAGLSKATGRVIARSGTALLHLALRRTHLEVLPRAPRVIEQPHIELEIGTPLATPAATAATVDGKFARR